MITILVLLLAATSPRVSAQPIWTLSESEQLDGLHDQLATAEDEATARVLADHIWTIWTQPQNEAIAERMSEIIQKSGLAGPFSRMPIIESLITDYPDYPEGWNLRAMARFFGGDNAGALSDIEQVVKREPRHFGALAGRTVILHAQGKGEEALAAIRQALAIHPFLPERHLFPETTTPTP
jgi:tetratricopeptide (TPR) repeat protein